MSLGLQVYSSNSTAQGATPLQIDGTSSYHNYYLAAQGTSSTGTSSNAYPQPFNPRNANNQAVTINWTNPGTQIPLIFIQSCYNATGSGLEAQCKQMVVPFFYVKDLTSTSIKVMSGAPYWDGSKFGYAGVFVNNASFNWRVYLPQNNITNAQANVGNGLNIYDVNGNIQFTSTNKSPMKIEGYYEVLASMNTAGGGYTSAEPSSWSHPFFTNTKTRTSSMQHNPWVCVNNLLAVRTYYPFAYNDYISSSPMVAAYTDNSGIRKICSAEPGNAQGSGRFVDPIETVTRGTGVIAPRVLSSITGWNTTAGTLSSGTISIYTYKGNYVLSTAEQYSMVVGQKFVISGAKNGQYATSGTCTITGFTSINGSTWKGTYSGYSNGASVAGGWPTGSAIFLAEAVDLPIFTGYGWVVGYRTSVLLLDE